MMPQPMTSLARIPFDARETQSIRTLCRWLSFVAIAHFLGTLAVLGAAMLFGVGAAAVFSMAKVAAVTMGLQAFVLLGFAATLAAQGWLLFETRGAFAEAVERDTHDQTAISSAFRRLKHFFLIEVVAFVLSVVLGLGSVVLVFATPDSGSNARGRSPGQQVTEMLQGRRR